MFRDVRSKVKDERDEALKPYVERLVSHYDTEGESGMAYEFLIHRLARPVASIRELQPPEEYPYFAVGTLAIGDDDRLDVFLYRVEPVNVRAEGLRGPSCNPALEKICNALGWTAYDLQNHHLLGASVRKL